MSEKKKILFIYNLKKAKEWADGLWAAMKVLEQDFEIHYLNLQSEGLGGSLKGYDMILGWGAFGSPVDLYIQDDFQDDDAKRGLLIGGNAKVPKQEELDRYSVLFAETDWVHRNLQLDRHPTVIRRAFGTNTDVFFETDMPHPVVWDYIGVGAFADWKRWHLMCEKEGRRLIIGEYQQENETESINIVRSLIKRGVMVSDAVSPHDLAHFLYLSRTLYIPADVVGGGERAILEARACGLEIEFENDNDKLKEVAEWEPLPDHRYYAKKIKQGIDAVL